MGITTAILLAAGRSQRMEDTEDKLMIRLGEREILSYVLETYMTCGAVDEIVLVCIPGMRARAEQWLATQPLRIPVRVVEGGPHRQQSVLNALDTLGEDVEYVLIHDGARAFVTADVVQRCAQAVRESGACIAAVPVKDTIKQADEGGFIGETPERARLWAAQTPQCFRREIILKAHQKAMEDGYLGTDDAVLCERMGVRVRLVEGSYDNIKLTTIDDVAVGRAILERIGRLSPAPLLSLRAGTGTDVHALGPGRPLVLGGVEIDHHMGLDGHSDADVLTHAIMDALLGAAALGDIGRHFPDTDPQYRDARSVSLLRQVVRLVGAAGFSVVNVDATVCAQAPRLSGDIPRMRKTLAAAMGIAPDCVSVKATTTERLGFEGREEGISAHAVALLQKVLI
jgi:2-C-methyl-D-erythritol 4-phosphate cytidylyltransferase/2-C-methyl-D-erythritol 2,4-cyclodiphosphate synthase